MLCVAGFIMMGEKRKITEAQNRRGWKGTWRSHTPTPVLEWGQQRKYGW